MACSCCTGITTSCCGTIKLPTNLHCTISGSGISGLDGTWLLTWNSGTAAWLGTTTSGTTIEFGCFGGSNACAYILELSGGSCVAFFVVNSGCGSSAGEWGIADCSLPKWQSVPYSFATPCAGAGVTTCTITP